MTWDPLSFCAAKEKRVLGARLVEFTSYILQLILRLAISVYSGIATPQRARDLVMTYWKLLLNPTTHAGTGSFTLYSRPYLQVLYSNC